MAFDWDSGSLADGLHCYRCGQFFEAHEHWELVWLAAAEPEKTFLQAIIQVSAAFHHLKKENVSGAVGLLRRALLKLDRYPEEYGGVAVETLRRSMTEWIDVLKRGTGAARYPEYPEIA